MTNNVIALLVAVAATTWIYTKLARSTGNNVQGSVIISGIAGVAIFLLVLFLLKLIPQA